MCKQKHDVMIFKNNSVNNTKLNKIKTNLFQKLKYDNKVL